MSEISPPAKALQRRAVAIGIADMHVRGGEILVQTECVKFCARPGIADHQRIALECVHPAPPCGSAPRAELELAMLLVEQRPVRLRDEGGAGLESSRPEARVLDLAAQRPGAQKRLEQALGRAGGHAGTLARRRREKFPEVNGTNVVNARSYPERR